MYGLRNTVHVNPGLYLVVHFCIGILLHDALTKCYELPDPSPTRIHVLAYSFFSILCCSVSRFVLQRKYLTYTFFQPRLQNIIRSKSKKQIDKAIISLP